MIRSIILATVASSAVLFSGLCRADCFDAAAVYQNVNPTTLRGIAVVESQNNPKALNRNKNGSVDFGLMQVNSIHLTELKRYGVHKRDLMNSCKNIYVAAWLLRRSMNRYGNTWKAVGGYHSNTPGEREQYALKVQKAVRVIIASRQQSVRVAERLTTKQVATLMASN